MLGTQSGAKVCRYERFVREPSLETALAYEAIFQRPASELFAGLYQRIQNEVAARAKVLARKTTRCKSNRHTVRKRQILSDIAASQSNKSGQS